MALNCMGGNLINRSGHESNCNIINRMIKAGYLLSQKSDCIVAPLNQLSQINLERKEQLSLVEEQNEIMRKE